MFDPAAQAKVMKAYSDASIGYTNAAFAAFNAVTNQTVSFWNGALQPTSQSSAPASVVNPWDPQAWISMNPWLAAMPGMSAASPAPTPFTNPWDPQAWMSMNPWLKAMPGMSASPAPTPFTNPWDPQAWMSMNPWLKAMPGAFTTSSASNNPFMPFQFGTSSPFETWTSWWTNASRYTTTTWPMATAMISTGMPQSIAWPMADANRAVMDATQTAAKAFDDTFPTYRSDSGHAVAQIRFANDETHAPNPMMMSPFAAGPMMLALSMGPFASAHATNPWLTLSMAFAMPNSRT